MAARISKAAGMKKTNANVPMPKKHGDNSAATMGGMKKCTGTKGM